ncbi:hypothetical protein ACFVU2_21235 [Leifsonia sp. NPDC058194]|uniref:hypothetical protein n=1 Tax=Leifsonia sp. NPDC058194 TaxID=3346374 RepID=UPI0036DD78E3
MRILTVRQPWAWAIIHGGKNVENRVRNIAGTYRGPVAIHVGLQYDAAWSSRALDDAMQASGARLGNPPMPWWSDEGHIIGVIDIVGGHHGPNTESSRFRSVRSCFQPGKPYGACSEWAEPDAFHLELAHPRALTTPIPYKGALGLRELPETIAAQVLAEVRS